MLYYSIKVLLSAIIIVAISEVAKRSTVVGAIVASIPLVSVLGMIWLYRDTHNVVAVARLSQDIFWLVIPSLLLFISLPIFLRMRWNFWLSLSVSIAITVVGYLIMLLILKRLPG